MLYFFKILSSFTAKKARGKLIIEKLLLVMADTNEEIKKLKEEFMKSLGAY